MSPPTDREQILFDFWGQIKAGKPIVGAGAGIGLSAKCIEAGNGDLIVIYNSGRFRMAGRGSLAGMMPYSNANDVVLDMAPEVLSVVRHTPVLAGVCGTDPFRNWPKFLRELQDLGFAGIQNFPTVGLIDGLFRQNLEETGMGFEQEVKVVKMASEMRLLTCPYVFTVEEAEAMANAGADIVVAHMGLTSSGSIGAMSGRTLDDCVRDIKAILDAATEVKKNVIVLCHGGPIAKPGDAQYVLDRVPGLHGFIGASSIERLPVEEAVEEVTREFKGIKVTPQKLNLFKKTEFIKAAMKPNSSLAENEGDNSE